MMVNIFGHLRNSSLMVKVCKYSIKSEAERFMCEKCIIDTSGALMLSYNFQINKKAYLQTLKFLPIPPNISITPIHTKK